MSEPSTNIFRRALREEIASFGLEELTERQLDQLDTHYSLLIAWNQKINLTRITKPEEAARLHYAESLYGGLLIDDARRILDIGSGAGFPAVPLAVLRQDIEVTALEANVKKSVFLKEVKDSLSLPNFKVAAERFEKFDWSAYDLLTSRAIESGAALWAGMIARLDSHQRLMLYTTRDVLAALNERASSSAGRGRRRVATHPIPHSASRIIAVFE
ncbi:MAG TPA: 16S rRNA (guanine(527)-N(7))-methyltransferase RsmG [Blastocatellia bacterium]|nr:16S rRNA (guanine(527)-N(7))-methyltransferase RsmG [Blastocatellia bacterium]